MAVVAVQVSDVTGDKRQEFELPSDVPVSRILAVLLQKMNLPQTAPDGQRLNYKFHHHRSGRQLLDEQCLSDVAIQRGDVIRLQPEIKADRNAPPDPPSSTRGNSSDRSSMNGATQPSTGNPSMSTYDNQGQAMSGPVSGGNPDAAIWYVAKPDGQREGPLPMAILRGRAASGQLSPNDLLWTQGFPSWMPARGVPELYGPSMGAPSGHSSSAPMMAGPIPASMLKNFVASIASPGFLRITGRIFGGLSIVLLLVSMPFWFFGYSWFMNALFFAFFFIAGEVSAQIIETQRRIETLLQSRPEPGK